MKWLIKIFFGIVLWLYFFAFTQTSAFLWEDLGLDLYKQIDEGLESLETKQYEYELSGQWEASINDVINPILADYWVSCDIWDSGTIESMLSDNSIEEIITRCVWDGNPAPAILVEQVQNALWYVRNTFKARAETKSEKTYEVARIGLYSDGNLENSPFDLIWDLLEIDKIIFSEELEYEGVPYEKSADEELDDFLEEDKSYLYPEEEDESEEEKEWLDDIVLDSPEDVDAIPEIIQELDYHRYVCAPWDDSSWLDEEEIETILWGIHGTGWYIPNPTIWEYPGGISPIWGWWNGPFTGGTTLTWSYTPVTDEWPCDWFFCIIIEFQKSDYGLAGWESMTIETILKRAAKHLEKPANASLTQRKQTTNNFELGSIIESLPDMLRGFWIEVSSKPVPILDVENGREDAVEWDLFEIENLLTKYYKNLGLDYERRNDLAIFESRTHEQKVFETAAGMAIPYPENRLNELESFKNALAENNRLVSVAVDKQIVHEDMREFADQFTELERFIHAIKDFVEAINGTTEEMKEIKSKWA